MNKIKYTKFDFYWIKYISLLEFKFNIVFVINLNDKILVNF